MSTQTDRIEFRGGPQDGDCYTPTNGLPPKMLKINRFPNQSAVYVLCREQSGRRFYRFMEWAE